MFKRVASLSFILIFASSTLPLLAIDLNLEAAFGNLGFSEDRKASDDDLGTASYNWGFTTQLEVPLNEGLQLQTAVHRDPITENEVQLAFRHQSEIVSMSVGAYLGVLESIDKPLKLPAGISASLEARLPGIGYAQVGAARPLGDEPSATGEYWQQSTHAGLGFYLPNVIAGFHFRDAEKLTATSDGQTRDQRTEYAFTTDVFAKNVPYTVFLTFGYRDYRRDFLEDGESTLTHAAGSLLFGARLNLSLTPEFSIFTELSNGIYTFGREELLGTFADNSYLFQTSAGISVALD